jgi:hypothetical protein
VVKARVRHGHCPQAVPKAVTCKTGVGQSELPERPAA